MSFLFNILYIPIYLCVFSCCSKFLVPYDYDTTTIDCILCIVSCLNVFSLFCVLLLFWILMIVIKTLVFCRRNDGSSPFSKATLKTKCKKKLKQTNEKKHTQTHKIIIIWNNKENMLFNFKYYHNMCLRVSIMFLNVRIFECRKLNILIIVIITVISFVLQPKKNGKRGANERHTEQFL